MIQFPIYRQSYNNYNSAYAEFCRQQPQYIMNGNIQNEHQTYFSDLTNDEYNASIPQRNVMLYERGKLEQLARYGGSYDCSNLYNKIKDNNDFKELINSKYLNSPEGFVRIINNLQKLEYIRQQKLSYNFYPPYQQYYNANMLKPLPYGKYDMKDYLKILNDFVKNDKLSDDLKQYFMYMNSDKIDLYYTKFDKISASQNPMEILTSQFPYVKDQI